MQSLILSLLYAFLFGVTSKIADLHDEHGLKSFRGADILFGFLWGITMFLSTLFYPKMLELHVAILILALLKMKIDYLNHAIGASVFILGALYIASYLKSINLVLLLFILLIYIVIDVIVKYYLSLKINRFLNLRFYISPIIYSILLRDPVPFILIIVEIAGVSFIEIIMSRQTSFKSPGAGI